MSAPHTVDEPPPAGRAPRTILIGLAVSALIALLLTVGEANRWSWPLAADERVAKFTRGWADPLGWPVDVAHAIGLATGPRWSTLLVVIGVLTLALARERAAAGFLALCGVGGVVVVELAKTSVGRARPPGAEAFEPDLLKSFPSGHASAGIYVYLALGLVLVQLGRARGGGVLSVIGRTLVVLGPVIGVSRLVLGVHWPSDVLAGWAFGSTVILAAAVLLWRPLGAGWTVPAGPVQMTAPGTTPISVPNNSAQVTSEPSERAE